MHTFTAWLTDRFAERGIDQIYPGLPGTFQEQLSVTFSLAVPFLSIIASGGSL